MYNNKINTIFLLYLYITIIPFISVIIGYYDNLILDFYDFS